MAKRDITKRPRRALSADERQELFREFKLGIFALAALVALVVTLCWDKGGSTEPAGEPGKDGINGKALVRVVWHPPGDVGGGRPPVQVRQDQEPKGPEQRGQEPVNPQPPARRRVEPRQQRRVVPPTPPQPAYTNYVVKRRDTFWKIAKSQLGDGKRWKEIWRANPGIRNPNKLKRGMVIRVPRSLLASDPAGRLADVPKKPGSRVTLDSSNVIK